MTKKMPPQGSTQFNYAKNYNTSARIQEALQHIEPSNRDTWVKMGMAIKSELDESGFDIWLEWSQRSESFNVKDARYVWKGINPAGRVTIGTLFHEARANGWRNDAGYQAPTPAEIAERRRITAEREQVERQRIESTKPIRKAAFSSILSQALPLSESDPALAYIRQRGLGELIKRNDLPAWFAVADLRYQQSNMTFPALVAPVLNLAGEVVNVHQTYLSADGRKARVDKPKLLMPSLVPGALNGAAVRLYKAGFVLAVAEGIETALAVRVARPDLPVWATVSAAGMASLQIPRSVKKVYVMADLDRSGSGQAAGRALSERLLFAGIDVRLCIPPGPIPEGSKGLDWLDVLNSQKVAA